MTAVVDKIWNALRLTCSQLNDQVNISFQEGNYSQFKKLFTDYYALFLKEFMMQDTRALDEHKQAAVIVISAIQSNAIQQTASEGEIALAPYAVALNVGFSFLLDRINEKLKDISVKPIEEFQLPYPIACDTPYFETLCRILYFENGGASKEGISYPVTFNIIEWADRFFLLEYILLQQNEINPWRLREDNP